MRTPILTLYRCSLIAVHDRPRPVVLAAMLVAGCALMAGCGSSGGGDSTTTTSNPPTTSDPGVPTALTVTTITLIGTIAPVQTGHQVAVEVDGQAARVLNDSWSVTIPYDGTVRTLRVVKRVDGTEVSSRMIDVAAQ